MSRRLFRELREERGLAYEANSGNTHYRDTGALEIYAAVDPKNATVAIETILVELEKLKSGIPESELTKSKEFAKGRLLLRMEDTRSVAGWIGSQELLLGQVRTVDEVLQRVDVVVTPTMSTPAVRFDETDAMSASRSPSFTSPFAHSHVTTALVGSGMSVKMPLSSLTSGCISGAPGAIASSGSRTAGSSSYSTSTRSTPRASKARRGSVPAVFDPAG